MANSESPVGVPGRDESGTFPGVSPSKLALKMVCEVAALGSKTAAETTINERPMIRLFIITSQFNGFLINNDSSVSCQIQPIQSVLCRIATPSFIIGTVQGASPKQGKSYIGQFRYWSFSTSQSKIPEHSVCAVNRRSSQTPERLLWRKQTPELLY